MAKSKKKKTSFKEPLEPSIPAHVGIGSEIRVHYALYKVKYINGDYAWLAPTWNDPHEGEYKCCASLRVRRTPLESARRKK